MKDDRRGGRANASVRSVKALRIPSLKEKNTKNARKTAAARGGLFLMIILIFTCIPYFQYIMQGLNLLVNKMCLKG